MDQVRIYGLDGAGPAAVLAETQMMHSGDREIGMTLLNRMFTGNYEFLAVGAGESKYICLAVGEVDLLAALTITVPISFRGIIYEGADVSGGTAIPIGNLNRQSSVNIYPGLVQLVRDPTVNSTGNALWSPVQYAGGNKSPGAASPNVHIKLKRNTQYLLMLTNTDNAVEDMHVHVRLAQLHTHEERLADE